MLKGILIVLHEPVFSDGKDNAVAYKSSLGIKMFIIYAVIYIGFVAINIYNPLLMEIMVISGLNLATVYGFLLIVGALILALIYNSLCSSKEKLLNSHTVNEKGN